MISTSISLDKECQQCEQKDETISIGINTNNSLLQIVKLWNKSCRLRNRKMILLQV